MYKDIKDKWIAALRSGKYKQGLGRLRKRVLSTNEEQFCCLGVLCDIEYPEKWRPELVYESLDVAVYQMGIYSGTIPTILEEAMSFYPMITLPDGMMLGSVKLNRFNRTLSFAELNDQHKLTFDQIADLIETYVHVEERPTLLETDKVSKEGI